MTVEQVGILRIRIFLVEMGKGADQPAVEDTVLPVEGAHDDAGDDDDDDDDEDDFAGGYEPLGALDDDDDEEETPPAESTVASAPEVALADRVLSGIERDYARTLAGELSFNERGLIAAAGPAQEDDAPAPADPASAAVDDAGPTDDDASPTPTLPPPPPRAPSPLGDAKADAVRRAMLNVRLPPNAAPAWAQGVDWEGEDVSALLARASLARGAPRSPAMAPTPAGDA